MTASELIAYAREAMLNAYLYKGLEHLQLLVSTGELTGSNSTADTYG